ncbi:MAG: glycosyltransferase, partial [Verrucomicrobiota bacterium]|nr:glycosyltransferase [Verrucomicrobiota bacterium]
MPDPAVPLKLFSIVIPARDEEASLQPTLLDLYTELTRESVPHEIIVVDDGSKDRTWEVLQKLQSEIPTLAPVQNSGAHGFGRAVA